MVVDRCGSCNGLSIPQSRRQAIQQGTAGLIGVVTTSAASVVPANAESSLLSESDLVVPKGKSVLVLGASGKTGRECVSALLASGRPCVATTRTGSFEYDNDDDDKLLSTAAADVTNEKSVLEAIQNSSRDLGAVIFAASASTKGGNAFAVDRDGVVNAARACLACGVPRLVVVSSGTVTRPDSAVYKLLNLVGKGIMEAKIQGEDTVRDLYADPAVLQRGLGYTVVRPGGLTTGQSLGPSALELNQGDTKSGRLSRADVAALCVSCLDSAAAFDTTFECYEKLTAKPIESVGLSNIVKSTDPTTFVSGQEQLGDTFDSLFQGLSRDEGHT